MRRDSNFNSFVVHDLLGEIPGITSRGMFGGFGIYQNGMIFAIIAEGRLYFKVGEGNRLDYESRGSKPFTYQMPGKKPMAMSYWELTEEIMENREKLGIWVAKAVAASRKGKKTR
jgi:DNA transformation protein